MTDKMQHFGIWIKKSNQNAICRENYAIIEKKSSTWNHKIALIRKSCYKTKEERLRDFDDEECRIYSDRFCKEWKEKCLYNFDKNMAFFEKIDRNEFEQALQYLVHLNQKTKEIFDLNECKGVAGVYIMVLDKYKQVYIGQAEDIKTRILSHWRKKKEFDRLIFGGVEKSVISIDCFGALDTTRIFVLENSDIRDRYERFSVSKMPNQFKLNRVGGGTPKDVITTLEILSELNLRKF